MIDNIKARYTAKPFNIWTEKIDYTIKTNEYLASDGYLYYGNRFLVFFKSSHNNWFKEKFNK